MDAVDDNQEENKADKNNKIDDAQYRREAMRAMGRVSQLGLTAVTCVIISLLVGYGLDRLFSTAPVFIVIFAFLGCGAAIKTMMDIAKKF